MESLLLGPERPPGRDTHSPRFSRRIPTRPVLCDILQQTGGSIVPVSPAVRSEGVHTHASSFQRLARVENRRRGVRVAHGNPRGDIVLPVLELFADVRAAHGRGIEGANL